MDITGPDDIKALLVGDPPPAPQEMTIETPEGQPNIIVEVVQPIVAIGIRTANTFINVLLGGLGLSAADAVIGTQLIPGNVWRTATIMALSAAAVSAIKNAGLIFSSLEKKYPLLNP